MRRRGTCSRIRSSASATTRSCVGLRVDGTRRRGRTGRRRRRRPGDRRPAHGLAQAVGPAPAEGHRWRQRQRQREGQGRGGADQPSPAPEPTVVLPPGMTISEPRVRGMALLFDISILIVIFFAVSLVVPRLIQSDYQDIQDRVSSDQRPQERDRRISTTRRAPRTRRRPRRTTRARRRTPGTPACPRPVSTTRRSSCRPMPTTRPTRSRRRATSPPA